MTRCLQYVISAYDGHKSTCGTCTLKMSKPEQRIYLTQCYDWPSFRVRVQTHAQKCYACNARNWN